MRSTRLLAAVMAVALVVGTPSAASAVTKNKYRVLHTFTGGKDGGMVASTLALDASGNPYGTAYSGGSVDEKWCPSGCGVIFKITPHGSAGWKESALLDFDSNTGGADWYAPLLFNSSGKLFGTTVALDYQHAYVFELTHEGNGWKFNPIYDAGYGLLFDEAGNLYGDIGPGKYQYYGAIAELSPGSNGWNYTDLYDFCSPGGVCPGGYALVAPPIWDGKGNMFGTTLYGGIGQPTCWISYGCGVVFEMTPNGDGTWTYQVLHRFASSKTDGQSPYGGLTMDAAGNLYGVTWAGGKYGNGTFFKMTPEGNGKWKETILYQFPNCNEGCGPDATLVFDRAGNLYGKGPGGNSTCGYTCGVIFKFSPQTNGTWKYSVVHKFNGNDGHFPTA